MKRGGNYTSPRFESGFLIVTGFPCHEPGETTSAVAAHFRAAPVAIIKLPAPLRLAGRIGHQQKKSVSPNAALTMTQTDHLLTGQLQLALTIIYEHKVVPGPVHLGKIHRHDRSNLAKKRGVQRGNLANSAVAFRRPERPTHRFRRPG